MPSQIGGDGLVWMLATQALEAGLGFAASQTDAADGCSAGRRILDGSVGAARGRALCYVGRYGRVRTGGGRKRTKVLSVQSPMSAWPWLEVDVLLAAG